jgi:hypothetical protein
MSRLTSKRKSNIRKQAYELVQYYSATLILDDDAQVLPWEKESANPDLPAQPGHIVAAWVFVPDDVEEF